MAPMGNLKKKSNCHNSGCIHIVIRASYRTHCDRYRNVILRVYVIATSTVNCYVA